MICLCFLDFVDCAIPECKEKVEEVSAAVTLPAKARSECQKAAVSNAAPIRKSAKEVSKDFEIGWNLCKVKEEAALPHASGSWACSEPVQQEVVLLHLQQAALVLGLPYSGSRTLL